MLFLLLADGRPRCHFGQPTTQLALISASLFVLGSLKAPPSWQSTIRSYYVRTCDRLLLVIAFTIRRTEVELLYSHQLQYKLYAPPDLTKNHSSCNSSIASPFVFVAFFLSFVDS